MTNIAELDIFYPQLVIESTDRFNRENPHIVKNFLRGFIEGLRYIAIHKDETKKTITRYLKTSDPDILEATYGSFMQVTNYNAVPNLEGIGNAIDEVGQRVPAAAKQNATRVRRPALLERTSARGLLSSHRMIQRFDRKGESMTRRSRSRVDLEKMRMEYEKFRSSVRMGANRGKISFRAVATIVENVHLEGTVRGFRLESDEPEERGGTNLAPAPLSYFLMGAAF